MKPTGQMQRRVLYAKTARPGRTGKARRIRRTTGTRKAGRLRQTGTGRPRRTASARLRPFQRIRRSGFSSSASAPSAAAPAIPAAPIRVPIGLPAGMPALCCRRCRHDCRPCRPVCLSSPLTTRPFFRDSRNAPAVSRERLPCTACGKLRLQIRHSFFHCFPCQLPKRRLTFSFPCI